MQNFAIVANLEEAEAKMRAHEEKFAAMLQSHGVSIEPVAEPIRAVILSQQEAEAKMRAAEERLASILEREQAPPSLSDLASRIRETSVTDIARTLESLEACNLEKFAAAMEDEAQTIEADQLIREELHREDHSTSEADQLIAEELSNSVQSWVAGSPAAAVRQMRRKSGGATVFKSSDREPATSSKHCSAMSLDLGLVQKSGSSQKSAMSLDLGIDLKSSRGQKSNSLQKSASNSSIGALQSTKNKITVDGLRPLVMSKSAGTIPSMSSLNSGKNPWAWDLGPMSGRSKGIRQPLLASPGFSLYSEFR
jgi:hypothetical protein